MNNQVISICIFVSALFLNACGGGGGGGGGSTPPPADITAPTVSITTPTAGTTGVWAYNVTATATDNVGVSKVDFYINNGSTNTLQSTSTVAPFGFRWNTATLPNGNYTLTARAYDAAGNNTLSSGVLIPVNHPVITASISTTVTVPTANAILTMSNAPPVDANFPEEGVFGIDFVVTFPSGAQYPVTLTPSVSNAIASGDYTTGSVIVAAGSAFPSGQIVAIPFTSVPVGATVGDFGVTVQTVTGFGGVVIQ